MLDFCWSFYDTIKKLANNLLFINSVLLSLLFAYHRKRNQIECVQNIDYWYSKLSLLTSIRKIEMWSMYRTVNTINESIYTCIPCTHWIIYKGGVQLLTQSVLGRTVSTTDRDHTIVCASMELGVQVSPSRVQRLCVCLLYLDISLILNMYTHSTYRYILLWFKQAKDDTTFKNN